MSNVQIFGQISDQNALFLLPFLPFIYFYHQAQRLICALHKQLYSFEINYVTSDTVLDEVISKD